MKKVIATLTLALLAINPFAYSSQFIEEEIVYPELEGYPELGYNVGFTPLMEAAVTEDVATVRDLIKNGADLNARDGKGRTALMIMQELLPYVKKLVDNGDDSALHTYRAYQAIEKLLKSKAGCAI